MEGLARRLNYFTAAFLGILGLAMSAEIFRETDYIDKVDDLLMLLIGLVSWWWYQKRGINIPKATMSVVFITVAILIKVMAIIIEHDDAAAVGDDVGVLSMLIIALVFVVSQTYFRKETVN
jgi:hypothetical protein